MKDPNKIGTIVVFLTELEDHFPWSPRYFGQNNTSLRHSFNWHSSVFQTSSPAEVYDSFEDYIKQVDFTRYASSIFTNFSQIYFVDNWGNLMHEIVPPSNF